MKYVMKYIFCLYLVLQTSLLSAQTSPEPLNVLFVGNSLTYFNDMPQTFKAITENQGFNINVDQHTIGSAGFDDHLGNIDLYQKLDNTVWDYVILQPGTAESIELYEPLAITILRAHQLREKIYENSPCASIYLYETAYGITGNTPAEYNQYQSIQEVIKNNLIKISNQTDLPLAPVGESFLYSLQQNPLLFLWVNYGDIHPNENGSFLAACTFYNSLFQKPITDSSFNSTLEVAEANYFRNIAETVTINQLDIFNIDTFTANASFTFNSNDGFTVNFNNTSTNYNSVFWDFGDGTTSSEINPTHQFDFSSQISYQVYLTAFLGCKESHFNLTISQSSLGTLSVEQINKFKVYPNPVINNLHIVSNSGTTFTYVLLDVFGNIIEFEDESYTNHVVNTSKLLNGIYFISISSNTNVINKKIIKL